MEEFKNEQINTNKVEKPSQQQLEFEKELLIATFMLRPNMTHDEAERLAVAEIKDIYSE